MYDSGKTLNKPSIEVAESNEGMGITWSLGYWPLFYGTHFARVHVQAFQGHQQCEVFGGCVMKLTLSWLNL
jgi:acid phosphatase family membrane protein YuiD